MQKYYVPQTTPAKLEAAVLFLKASANATPLGRIVGRVYHGYVCEVPRPLNPLECRITGAFPLPKAAAA